MFRKYEDMPKIEFPHGNDNIMISDSTIRDGSQMAGIVMKKWHKLQIYEYLHRIGIEKLELFLFSDTDQAIAKEMLDKGYELPEVTGWARANPKDIDSVLKIDEIKETGILMSVSESHMFDKMGLKTKEEAEDKYLKTLDYALDHGLKVRCHLEDVTRADIEGFVIPFSKEIIDRSPDAIIRVCDTLNYGVSFLEVNLPYSVPKIILGLKDIGVKHIETHVHDDFGFGVAATMAGYWYGADWSSLTFLGIGERAGNTELEKILLFLQYRLEGFDKYNLECLTEFSRYMESEIGIRVPRNKSVVGMNVFSHESGIHSAGVIKNPFTYEPYPPELVGGTRQLLIGPTSGTEIVRFKVEEALKELMKIDVAVDKNDSRVLLIHNSIKKIYDEEDRRSCISDEEIRGYVEEHFMFKPIVEKDVASAKENNNKEKF